MYSGGGNSGGFGYPPVTSGYPLPSQQPGGFNVAPGKICIMPKDPQGLISYLLTTFGNEQIRNRAYF